VYLIEIISTAASNLHTWLNLC